MTATLKNTIKNNCYRIAFVTSNFLNEKTNDGGMEKSIYRMALSLMQAGHNVVVVTASTKNQCICYNGIEIHRVIIWDKLFHALNILSFKKFQNTLWWIWQSLKLNRIVKKIHKYTPLSLIEYSSVTAPSLFRLRCVPSAIRVYCNHKLCMDANETALSYDDKIIVRLERFANKHADAVSCPSNVIAEYTKRQTGKNVELIEYSFYPDMDKQKWDILPYKNLLKDKKYLLYYGRLSILKGMGTISRIIYPLLEKHPDLYFVFIGKDGDYCGQSMIDYLWQQSASHRGRVIYMGRLNAIQLYPILQHAYAVVLPSRIDNLPNTCMESMFYKRIVIGTHGTSFEQLIDHGRNGFLCPPDNPDKLLEVIDKVLSLSPSQRNKIGDQAYKRICEQNPDKIIPQFMRFYENVIENHR